MKIITIIISGLLLSLIGCSSSQVSRHQNTPSNESIEFKAAKKMAAFDNADANTVLYPYILLLAKANNIVDDQDICLPENTELYEEMYKLNKSSMVANSLLGYCGDENEKLIQEYLQTFIAVMENLLKKNDGSSKNNAVEIREFSEAEMILTAGEYTILDYEIVEDGGRFYYRIHAVDNLTGAFEYHYYKNFNFLKKVYSKFTTFKNDAEVSKFALAIFQKIDNPATTNWLTNHLLTSKKYEEVILKLKDSKTLTPISRVNLARAYLYSNKDESLDSLLDDLIEQKESGDINAAIFLVELLENLNSVDASSEDIDELLDEVDMRTGKGHATYLMSLQHLNFGTREKYGYWKQRALADNQENNYRNLSAFLKKEKYFDEYIDLLKEQHAAGYLESSYHLAYEYRKGRYVEKDLVRQNELFLEAAEKGHLDSMYRLAGNYLEGGGAKIDADKALYWFKKAGTAKSLNQVGYIYYEGVGGIDIDYSSAMKWFQKASDLGNTFSTSNLGLFYQYGNGVEIDYTKAIDLYKEGITSKYLITYKRLGDIYQHSLGKKYYKEAEYWYEKGALAGDIKSYERLGDLYQYNKGERDKAAKWYKLGAELGHVRSQYEYGLIYARHLDNEQLTLKWFEFVYNSNDREAIRLVGNSLSNGEKYLKIDQDKAIMFYKKSSSLGNIKAHTDLGYHYETGNGIEKSLEKARRLYQKSATQGNAQGINNLATFYKDGKGGLNVDLEEAFKLYSKASALGNVYAHNNLAKMYFYGEYVDKNFLKALEVFKKAAKLNFEESYFYLGDLYLSGKGGTKNYKLAHNYFEKSVAYGDGDSADNLGVMYSQGMGVKKDLELSADYFGKAAKLHEIETNHETYIADKFYFGTWGTERDFSYAKKHYQRAVQNGSAAAMNNLGEMYRLGQGVTIDYLKAISLYKKAIEKEDEVAMFNMSEFYRDGLGVKKNANKEFEWMERSANSGFLPAYVDLSRMYKNATGTNKDIIKSIEWLKKGVEEELSSAIYEMSRRLYTGDEIGQNIEEAKKLMQVAADAGDEKALEAIESNFKDME